MIEIKKLKELIKDLPDDMEVVISNTNGNQDSGYIFGDGISRENEEGMFIHKPDREDYDSDEDYNKGLQEWSKTRNSNGKIVECLMINVEC